MSWSDLLESVFTSVRLAVYRLENVDTECLRQMRALDTSLDRLRGAISKQREDQTISRIARESHDCARVLAKLVENTPARTAVTRLMGLLASYETEQKIAA